MRHKIRNGRAAVAEKSKFVVILKVQGQEIANVIKAHLESEGIPVFLEYESASLIYGITADGIGEVRILVPGKLAEEAKLIIQPQTSPKGGDQETG
jgi:hypothetical protein